LCYNCDESFVRDHQCKRVFYLEARDFTDDNDTSTDHETINPMAVEEGATDAMANALVVSLYALAGIRTVNSMVVPVMIKGERLLALLDTGSTHNFLRGDTMQRLGLVTSGGDQLRVTVANGDRLPCESIARDVPIVIEGAVFSVTCAGIDLGDFDFILGVDFLCTLGPILWDLDAMTMSFLHQGACHHGAATHVGRPTGTAARHLLRADGTAPTTALRPPDPLAARDGAGGRPAISLPPATEG
jgi:hypothetical protein